MRKKVLRRVVALDVDEVVFPFAFRFWKTIRRQRMWRHVPRPNPAYGFYRSWGMKDHEFWRAYYAMVPHNFFMEGEAITGAQTAVQKLKKQGYDIHFVTHRALEGLEEECERQTKEWLISTKLLDSKDHTNLHVLPLGQAKGPTLQEIGAHVFVDDSFHNLESARTHGVPYTLHFAHGGSELAHINSDFQSLLNWDELYQTISQIS